VSSKHLRSGSQAFDRVRWLCDDAKMNTHNPVDRVALTLRGRPDSFGTTPIWPARTSVVPRSASVQATANATKSHRWGTRFLKPCHRQLRPVKQPSSTVLKRVGLGYSIAARVEVEYCTTRE
jgi:hypothetical protein